MISEFFLNIVFGLVEWMLSPIPDISVPVSLDMTSSFWQFVKGVLYFFPLGTIGTLVGITLALGIFRIFIAIVRTVWDLLPFA